MSTGKCVVSDYSIPGGGKECDIVGVVIPDDLRYSVKWLLPVIGSKFVELAIVASKSAAIPVHIAPIHKIIKNENLNLLAYTYHFA